jgi:hypothetical protein
LSRISTEKIKYINSVLKIGLGSKAISVWKDRGRVKVPATLPLLKNQHIGGQVID